MSDRVDGRTDDKATDRVDDSVHNRTDDKASGRTDGNTDDEAADKVDDRTADRMIEKITVLLVEDDLDFVYLIRKMLERDSSLYFLGHVDNKTDAVNFAKRLSPNIVLMDLNLSKSELDGIEAAREIRLATDARVLLLTSFEQSKISINASKKAFASGYIFKSQCQTLTETIRKTARTQTPQGQFIREMILQDLTATERHIFGMMLGEDGTTQSTEKTIANQKTSIFRKLGLKNRNELLHIFRNW